LYKPVKGGEYYHTSKERYGLFMKVKVMVCLCASVLVAFLFMSVLPIHGEEKIYSDMVRLHVIAASDSEEDQAVKLLVRDAVLEVVEGIVENVENQEEAATAIAAAEDEICIAAQAVLQREGFDYPVSVELGLENYPERVYEGFTLPAGQYTSLRVILDGGDGKNWWCVLYPPLCTSAAEERERVFITAGFTDEQYKTITETGTVKYKVKFKILEVLASLFGENED